MSRKWHPEDEFIGIDAEHAWWVQWKGGYFATCKGCELPMPHGATWGYDCAICWDCADGIDLLFYDILYGEDDDDAEDYADSR